MDVPPGISVVVILYALVKQCRTLGAYKFARTVYQKLQRLHIPARFVPIIEMGDLTIRAKPFNDAEDLLPLCYRCSTTNPLANPKGNQCVNCQQEFVYSIATFDVLPIVKFEIEESLTDEEAINLIRASPEEPLKKRATSSKSGNRQSRRTQDHWEEETSSHFESLRIRDENYFDASEADLESLDNQEVDPFTIQMSSLESMEGKRVVADYHILSSLRESEVFMASPPEPLRKVFFKNLMPEMSIIMCPFCHRFCLEDFESNILQDSRCSFCRNKLVIKQ